MRRCKPFSKSLRSSSIGYLFRFSANSSSSASILELQRQLVLEQAETIALLDILDSSCPRSFRSNPTVEPSLAGDSLALPEIGVRYPQSTHGRVLHHRAPGGFQSFLGNSPTFDFDNDGTVSGTDFLQFRSRFLQTI